MRAYREEGFPITIVRPSLTYGNTQITLAINSWAKSYTEAYESGTQQALSRFRE